MKEKNKKFTIIKKIAKHGNQAIIVVPRVLESMLPPGTVAQLTIDVLKDAEVQEINKKQQ